MRKIYSYAIVFLAALSLSTAFASAQTSGSGSNDTTTDSGLVLNKYVSPKNSDGTYTLTLEAFATGSSITSSSEVAVPLDIVLVLDLSGSMSNSYTPKTANYTARTSTAYTYNSYGTNQYYYKHSNDKYYLVSRSTYDLPNYTAVTTSDTDYSYNAYGSNQYYYLHDNVYSLVNKGTYDVEGYSQVGSSTTTYSYSGYGSNQYYYLYNGKYCLVTSSFDTEGSSEYTPLASANYSYDSYGTNQYYYKDGNSYYLVSRSTGTAQGGTKKGSTVYYLTFEKNNTTYYLYKNGNSYTYTDKPNQQALDQTSSSATIYSGVLYKKGTNYYYLTFTDGGTTYYLTADGNVSTTRPSVTSTSGTLYTGLLYSKSTTTYYYLSYEDGGKTYYLTTDGNSTETPTGNTSSTAAVYHGKLYQAGTGYALSYIVGSTTYYLTASGSSTVKSGATSNTGTIYTGVLYTQSWTSGTATTRLAALKTAVAAFINTVKENAVADNVNHRISIVKFGTYLEPTVGNLFWANTTWGQQNQTQVVTDLQSVKDYSASMITTVNNFIAGGSTPSDWGLMLGGCVLNGKIQYTDHKNNTSTYTTGYNGYNADGSYNDKNGTVAVSGDTLVRSDSEDANVKAGAKKLVVFFTDGQPYMDQNNGATGFTVTYRNVKDYAVEEAKKIKDSGALLYAVAVVDDATSKFTDNTSTSGQYSINEFMNYVSSNYPNATKMSNPGEKAESADYYKLANGNLTDIFVSIAEQATTGGAKRQLSGETTTAIDAITDDFALPDGTDATKIGLYVDELTSYNAEGTSVYKKYVFDSLSTRKTLVVFNNDPNKTTNASYVTVDPDTKKIKVKGFDYTKADVTSGSTTTYGNWVGPRTKTSGGTTTTVYKGRRLVITIPIVPTSDYEGGYNLPTNKEESGIYVDGEDEPIGRYPVPKLDFPSIGIIKEGLKKGESAVFTVVMTNKVGGDAVIASTPYKVVLTGDGSGKPAYAIIKDLPEGTYKVTEETNWSWSYDVTKVVVKDATGTQTTTQNVSFKSQLLAKNMIADWPTGINETVKCVLFTFTNAKKSGDDGTVYAESVVKNVFTGGNQTTTSNVTTNSKTQPGDSSTNSGGSSNTGNSTNSGSSTNTGDSTNTGSN